MLACAHETACRLLGRKSKLGSPAVVVHAVDRVLKEYEQGEPTHVSEITPRPQPPVVVKKRNSAQIDGEPVQHDCDMASESRANPDVSNESADKSATPPPKSETGIPASPPSPPPLPWGALRVEPVAVIVFAAPGQCFQVRSGYGAPAYDSL